MAGTRRPLYLQTVPHTHTHTPGGRGMAYAVQYPSIVKVDGSYPEQTDSCKWLASEFLSTCGSSENSGQAPVTFTLYLYDTLTTANPVPVAVMFTVRVRFGSLGNKKGNTTNK